MVLEEAADKRPGNGWLWKEQGWRGSDELWASKWVGCKRGRCPTKLGSGSDEAEAKCNEDKTKTVGLFVEPGLQLGECIKGLKS